MIKKVTSLLRDVVKSYWNNPLIFLILLLGQNINLITSKIPNRYISIFFSIFWLGWVGFKYELIYQVFKKSKFTKTKSIINKYLNYLQTFWPYFFLLVWITLSIMLVIGFTLALLFKDQLELLTYLKSPGFLSNFLMSPQSLFLNLFRNPSSISTQQLLITSSLFLVDVLSILLFSWGTLVLQFYIFNKLKDLNLAIKNSFKFIKEEFAMVAVLFTFNILIRKFLIFFNLFKLSSKILNFSMSSSTHYLFFVTIPRSIWSLVFISSLFLLVSNYLLKHKELPEKLISQKFKLKVRDFIALLFAVLFLVIGLIVGIRANQKYVQQINEIKQFYPSDIPVSEEIFTKGMRYKLIENGKVARIEVTLDDWVEQEKIIEVYKLSLMNNGWEIREGDYGLNGKAILVAVKDNRKLQIRYVLKQADKVKEIEFLHETYSIGIPMHEGSMVADFDDERDEKTGIVIRHANLIFDDLIDQNEVLNFYKENIGYEGWTLESKSKFESENTLLRATKDDGSIFEIRKTINSVGNMTKEFEIYMVVYPRG